MKSTDFLKEHNAFIAQDADEMHRDQEVQMARADLYNAADYAIKLHKILRGVSDSTDMEQWVMEKIAIANENLRTVYEYMNYEAQESEGALPTFQFESAEKQYDEILEEDWKSALAGGALAASMALGGGAAHADEAPRDVPSATQQADTGSIGGRYTQGIDFSSAPYTINAGGKEYKFAGRDAEAPKGQAVIVPAALIGIRGLKPVKVILGSDGKYYSVPLDEAYTMADVQRDAQANARKTIDQVTAPKEKTPFMAQVGKKIIGGVTGAVTGGIKGAAKGFGFTEGDDERKQNALWAEINRHEQAAKKSKDLKQQHHLKMADQLRSQLKTSDNEVTESCDASSTGASAMATGAVGAVAPQRRVKQESAATKKYGNAMKTKAPKIGKGVY